MAAVVVQTATAPWYGKPIVNVSGNQRQYYYNFAIAADADWLIVPMRSVASVHLTDTALTAMGVASIAIEGYGSRITFNSGGALAGVNCTVTGH